MLCRKCLIGRPLVCLVPSNSPEICGHRATAWDGRALEMDQHQAQRPQILAQAWNPSNTFHRTIGVSFLKPPSPENPHHHSPIATLSVASTHSLGYMQYCSSCMAIFTFLSRGTRSQFRCMVLSMLEPRRFFSIQEKTIGIFKVSRNPRKALFETRIQ
jgi:hypothetical protein